MRAGEAIPVQAANLCISLDGTMFPMIAEGKDGDKTMRWIVASLRTISFHHAQGVSLRSLYLGRVPEPRRATLQ